MWEDMTRLSKNMILLPLEGVLKAVWACESLDVHAFREQATHRAESDEGPMSGYTYCRAKVLCM